MRNRGGRSLLVSLALAGASIMAAQPAKAEAPPPEWGYAQTWYKYNGTMKRHADFPCLDDRNWGRPQWPIDWVYNVDCPRRFWLHENADRSGHDICVGPGKSALIPERWNLPMRVVVGDRSPCP